MRNRFPLYFYLSINLFFQLSFAQMTAEDQKKFEEGETVIFAKKEGAKTIICARAKLQVPTEFFWQTLEDYPNFPQFMPNMKKCEILKQKRISPEEEEFHVYNELIVSLKKIYYTLKLIHNKKKGSITWTLIDGNIKMTEGFWLLEEKGNYTEITYEVYTDPGMWVPDFVYRSMTSETVRGVIKGGTKWAKFLEKTQKASQIQRTLLRLLPQPKKPFSNEEVLWLFWFWICLLKLQSSSLLALKRKKDSLFVFFNLF